MGCRGREASGDGGGRTKDDANREALLEFNFPAPLPCAPERVMVGTGTGTTSVSYDGIIFFAFGEDNDSRICAAVTAFLRFDLPTLNDFTGDFPCGCLAMRCETRR